MAAALGKLPPEELGGMLDQLTHRKQLVGQIDWSSLLRSRPLAYARPAARAALVTGTCDLLSALRSTPSALMVPEVLHSLGELKDRESVPLLISQLAHSNPLTRMLMIETLGRIGGPEARQALRQLLARASGPDVRMIYRSLSRCAEEEDSDLFQERARHPDWMVRLASVEMLGRFPTRANVLVLSSLASDPVTIVAQRALALLEQY